MKAMYEPVHGSAPDIAEKGISNPLAMILVLQWCLNILLKINLYELINKAKFVLSKGYEQRYFK